MELITLKIASWKKKNLFQIGSFYITTKYDINKENMFLEIQRRKYGW